MTLAVLFVLLLIAVRPARAQTETVLYNFCSLPDCSDGAGPSGLTFHDGSFYGTTNGLCCGHGNVFELSPNGSGGWSETVLYAFTGGADGNAPNLSPVTFDGLGNIYGTTLSGGEYYSGVVFELTPVGTGWTEKVLYNATITPAPGVIMDSAGNLYGTTYDDGEENVFELSPSASGWTAQVLYTVQTNNERPMSALTMDSAGNLYATAIISTSANFAFELSPDGSGGWTPTVLHNFCSLGDGCEAYSGLVLDQAGNLYGTTATGGKRNQGTVYELSRGANGQWTETILHSFKGAPKDGAAPLAAVVLDGAGNIYGTTSNGGDSAVCGDTVPLGCGTVFELLAPTGNNDRYEEKVLWIFNNADGVEPQSSLILDSAGNLYGTTLAGGANREAGVVFEVTGVVETTKTTLMSSLNPSTDGEPVTFTAVVTPSAGAIPAGETVSFMMGTTVLGTGTLSGGSASFTTSTLKVGTTAVKAVYGGDSNFNGSTSKVLKQVVKK